MYVYVGNDPTNGVDPDGLRLIVGSQRGSMSEISMVWKAIGQLRSTEYGEKLYQKINNSARDYTVWVSCGKNQSKGSYNSGYSLDIYINLLNVDNAFVFFAGSNGNPYNTFTLERVVAHEMAHWLTRSESLAVKLENAIVAPLESGNKRVSY